MVRLLAAPEGRLMADPQVIHALRRRYRELIGRGGSPEDVAHVAAVLLIFRPGEDLSALARLRPYSRAGRNSRRTWVRGALDVLRTANGPMTAREIAERLIADQGLPLTTALRINVVNSLLIGLTKKPGVVCHPGRPRQWHIR